MQDTIYALSSGVGRAGVSVVRLSGEGCLRILKKLKVEKTLKPRYATLTKLYCPYLENLIDEVLLIYFPAPYSFTGEDVVEIHLHGSKAILENLFSVLEKMDNTRLAEAGEFSKRAFENNKMDLTEAEGLIDLINSETLAQVKQAQRQMSGNLKILYSKWTKDILSAVAHYEAYIDFPDEDIPDTVQKNVQNKIHELLMEIKKHLSDGYKGEAIREGIRVAIIGEPNAGKSSLINLLAKRDIAIVSEHEGTTRDAIETSLDLKGYPVRIFDTAGLRESTDDVEKEGILRAKTIAQEADIVVLVIDGTRYKVTNTYCDMYFKELNISEYTPKIVLVNKEDSGAFKDIEKKKHIFSISLHKEQGLVEFLEYLSLIVEKEYNTQSDPIITRTRHREALKESCDFLERAYVGDIFELVAEDLRLAMRSIGKITGKVDVEDVLDVVFKDFCIGK